MKFQDFNLSESVARAVEELEFDTPTPIQQASIPQLLNGRDLMGESQTGTGKTFAFAIPVVEMIDPSKRVVQAIVLTPTRELAIQVAKEFEKIGKHKKTRVMPIYGGQSIGKQINQLRKGVHVVVGTLGRVIDHIKRGTLKLKSVRFTVLDEADRMLDMGFIDDMKFILARIPQNGQKMMFSATMLTEITKLAKKYLKDPVEILIPADTLTVPETRQMFFEVMEFYKLKALRKLIDTEKDAIFLVFCRTKAGVDVLEAALIAQGYNARAIHGDYSQREREKAMKLFRKEKIDILVATDVAARGLDVDGITHVVNYDIPEDPESYVHRIGRTGRAGREGTAITFITPLQYGELKRIQAFSKVKMEKMERASIPAIT